MRGNASPRLVGGAFFDAGPRVEATLSPVVWPVVGLGVALCFLGGRLHASADARLRVEAALSWAPGLRLTRSGADLRGPLRLAQDRRRSLLVENLDGGLRG